LCLLTKQMIINTKNITFKKDNKGDYFEYIVFKNITVKKGKLADILLNTYVTLDTSFIFKSKEYYFDGRVPFCFDIEKGSFPIESFKTNIKIKVHLKDLRFEYIDIFHKIKDKLLFTL
jgi:hypothetical protein